MRATLRWGPMFLLEKAWCVNSPTSMSASVARDRIFAYHICVLDLNDPTNAFAAHHLQPDLNKIWYQTKFCKITYVNWDVYKPCCCICHISVVSFIWALLNTNLLCGMYTKMDDLSPLGTICITVHGAGECRRKAFRAYTHLSSK